MARKGKKRPARSKEPKVDSQKKAKNSKSDTADTTSEFDNIPDVGVFSNEISGKSSQTYRSLISNYLANSDLAPNQVSLLFMPRRAQKSGSWRR